MSKKYEKIVNKIIKKLSSTNSNRIDLIEFIGIASDLRTPFIHYMSKKTISWGKSTYIDLVNNPKTKKFT